MSDDQQYPYGQNGQQGPEGQQGPRSPQYDQYGRPFPAPQDPYPGEHGNPGVPQGQVPGHQVPGHQVPGQPPAQGWHEPPQAAPQHQTWEGQTWDTQYQPHVTYPQQAQTPHQAQVPQHARHAQAAPYPPAGTAQAPAGYPPHDAVPLPPETAGGGPGAGQAPFAYAPQPAPGAAAPGLADPAAYSPPTTLGNARVTDAQRARAEGRSPIIPPGIQPAGLTAVLGLLLAGGAALGPYALLVPLVLLQAVTAAGWFRLNGMWPARQGIALAFLGGLVSDAVLLFVGKEHAPAAIIGTLGVWVLLTVVLQLRSRAGADERMQGLMATVASAALAILATGHLAAVPDAVVVGAVAVAVATVARALPLPGVVSVVVSLLAAAGAGIAVGGTTDLGSQGALLGLGAGVCALIGLRAASYDYPSRFVHMTAGVALPLTAAAPAVYLLGRALS